MTKIIRKRAPGELKIITNGEPVIFAEGRIGAIVHFPVLRDEGQGYVAMDFEKFVRAPGTRIMAIHEGKMYLQKEARLETAGFDWRLPGGKVVDTFIEYKKYLQTPIPESVILEAAAKELKEEAGLVAGRWSLFRKKICGTTVEWDLYYVVAEDVGGEDSSRVHVEGEEVNEKGWFDFEEVKKMCERGEISEGRTQAALIEFLSH